MTNPIPAVAFARTDFPVGPSSCGGLPAGCVAVGSVVTGDFNGDGILDVAAGIASDEALEGGTYSISEICVYIGIGDGFFEAPACYSAPTENTTATFIFGSGCRVVAADFNGDGKLDLLCTTLDGSYFIPLNAITTFFGNGDGTFQTPGKTTTYDSSNTLETVVGVGDFNHDGKLDLVAIDSGGASLALGNGDGTFGAASTILSATDVSVTIGDFNRDGNLDVVVVNETSGLLQIFLGNGDGTFQTPQTIASIPPSFGALVSAEDVNNDGNLDLVAYESSLSSSVLSVFLGNGNGTFQNPQNSAASDVDDYTAFGDINGDGRLDTVTTEGFNGILLTQLGNGDGTFQTPLTYPAPDVSYPALGDFNGDGKMDMAAFTNTSGNINLSTFLQGTFPIASLSPNTLNFTELPIGQSASQPVTLTNSGNETLTISNSGFTGTNSADFSQTNNCGSSLAANASCTINVKFTSQGGGSLTASLAVTDNAAGSPQSVPITAISPDFSIKANTASSVTVSPGQTATYGITVASVQNFVGTVALSCNGGPPGSNCTVVPGSAAVEAPVTATVTVSTPASSAGIRSTPVAPPFAGLNFLSVGLFALFLVPLAGVVVRTQRLRPGNSGLCVLVLVLAALAMQSCGGGGGGGPTNYAVTVRGAYSANGVTVNHALNLTFIVQK